jgi:hypothetical protein
VEKIWVDKTLVKLLREYRDLLKIMNPGVRKHLIDLLKAKNYRRKDI